MQYLLIVTEFDGQSGDDLVPTVFSAPSDSKSKEIADKICSRLIIHGGYRSLVELFNLSHGELVPYKTKAKG